MLKLFIIIFILVEAPFIYIHYLEKTHVFFPDKDIKATPEKLGLFYEEVIFDTGGGLKLQGWFFPYTGAKHTILFLHGNAGNISDRLEKIVYLLQAKANIFIIDYRGYGKSEGTPTEKGIYEDSLAAYAYLVSRKGIEPLNIIIYGESLGSAAAIDLASNVKVLALIIEGGFSSGRDMGSIMFPYIPAFMLPDRFNSLEKIKHLEEPKLFIHSRDDEVVPLEFANKLYAAACEPKFMHILAGTHNRLYLDSKEEYMSAVKNFLKNLPK